MRQNDIAKYDTEKSDTAPDDIAKAVGDRVRSLRRQAGLSRKRLAAAAAVSERYLADLETGQANASVGLLARLADALSLDVACFLPPPRRSIEASPLTKSAPSHLAELVASLSAAEQSILAPLIECWLGDRRRDRKGIALLGLRGAGKTTLGTVFAERHRLPFVSITREIEKRAGMNLADLFNLGGPDGYRALENEVIADILRRNDHIVLETAGGIAGNSEALGSILGAFKTVWIRATPDEHLARVMSQGDLRPMHGNPQAREHLKALLSAREPEYARAECVLDTSGRTIEACLAELESIAGPLLTWHPAQRGIQLDGASNLTRHPT